MKNAQVKAETKTTMLRIQITTDELKALKQQAKADDRTLTAYVRRLIRKAGGFDIPDPYKGQI